MAANLVEFARELKQQVPIDQLIGDYIPNLRRAGRSFKGLCPFHEEKTPSFHIHPDEGYFYCFGCQARGDAIKFIQDYEKVDFRLAVEMLAKRFGVPIPEFRDGLSKEQRDEAEESRNALLAVCKIAEEIYFQNLWSHSEAAKAREYLHGRGLNDDQIRLYRLGYAAPEYEGLLREARRRGYAPERVAEAGLAIRKDEGGFYDRFRNRIIFPIVDPRGDIVAFGGRLIEGDGPKYLNSADSPIYHKGKLLYGWKAAREAIRSTESVVLLEGYMDWISLHSAGIENALAGCGTAFGDEQARLAGRIARTVYLHYDGDEAGRKASFRAAELLLAQGVTARVIELPEEHDPDSFIRAKGKAATQRLMEDSKTALDHFLEEALASHPSHSPEGKVEVILRLAPLIRAIKEPSLNEAYLNRVAQRLGLDAATVKRSLARSEKPARAPRRDTSESGLDLDSAATPPAAIDKREMLLLHLLITNLRRLELFQVFHDGLFSAGLTQWAFRTIAQAARDLQEGGEPPEDWGGLCETDHEREFLHRVIFADGLLAGGEMRLGEVNSSPARVDQAIEELHFQLKRKWTRRQRGAYRAQATLGSHHENAELKATIHAVGQSAVRETEIRFNGDGA